MSCLSFPRKVPILANLGLVWSLIKSHANRLCLYIVFSPSAACLFRFNGLSFVYLIYLLLIPLFAEPTSTTMQGKHTNSTPKSNHRDKQLQLLFLIGANWCPNLGTQTPTHYLFMCILPKRSENNRPTFSCLHE